MVMTNYAISTYGCRLFSRRRHDHRVDRHVCVGQCENIVKTIEYEQQRNNQSDL